MGISKLLALTIVKPTTVGISPGESSFTGRRPFHLEDFREDSFTTDNENHFPWPERIVSKTVGGESLELKVKKRDGSQENFEQAKIARAAQRAGVSREVAQRIAEAVENKLSEEHMTHAHSLHIVPSADIRKLVVEELRRSDTTSARAFENHSKHTHH